MTTAEVRELLQHAYSQVLARSLEPAALRDLDPKSLAISEPRGSANGQAPPLWLAWAAGVLRRRSGASLTID